MKRPIYKSIYKGPSRASGTTISLTGSLRLSKGQKKEQIMKNFDFLNPENLGKEYKGFILLKIEDVPDYKCKSVFLRHKRTGLEVFHL